MIEKKRVFLKRAPDPAPVSPPKGLRFAPKGRVGPAQATRERPKPTRAFQAPLPRRDSRGKAAVLTFVIIGALLVTLVVYAASRPKPPPPAPAESEPSGPKERMWMRDYMKEHGDPEALKARRARMYGQPYGPTTK